MLRTSADYLFGPVKTKIMPLNYDGSTPLPLDGVAGSVQDAIGGIGPWDFSGVADNTAVEFKIKLDATEDSVTTINLSAAVSASAVTAAEMVTAITTAAYTGVTASVNSDGYLQIAVTTPVTERYIQVYGEGAEIAEFGQGYGLEFITLDTQQSFSLSPNIKDSETITIADSNGLETELITDSYRKGVNGVLTDTALDYYLKAILEGGTYDSTNGDYFHPTSEDEKAYFCIELVQKIFKKGTNKSQDLVAYLVRRIYTAVAEIGDEAGDRNWQTQIYNITATSYKNSSGVISTDMLETRMTKAAFEALDWDDI